MDSDRHARSNFIGDQDPQTGWYGDEETLEVSVESFDPPPPYSISSPTPPFKDAMSSESDSWNKDSLVSSSESKRHPTQGGSSQHHAERNFAVKDPHTGEGSTFLPQRSMHRPTEHPQPHRQPSTRVPPRYVPSQNSALQREVSILAHSLGNSLTSCQPFTT